MKLQIVAKPSYQCCYAPGKYKRRVRWTCRSDFAFCQITLVFVKAIAR